MIMTDDKSSTVRRWRTEVGAGHPAGDLYANGAFSVADMIGRTGTGSGKCGTACTGSGIFHCC